MPPQEGGDRVQRRRADLVSHREFAIVEREAVRGEDLICPSPHAEPEFIVGGAADHEQRLLSCGGILEALRVILRQIATDRDERPVGWIGAESGIEGQRRPWEKPSSALRVGGTPRRACVICKKWRSCSRATSSCGETGTPRCGPF